MFIIKQMFTMLFRHITKRGFTLDQVINITVLIISFSIISLALALNFYKGIPLVAAIMVGSVVYLLFRDRLRQDTTPISFKLGDQIRPLYHIIFCISLSLMIYITWSNLYSRPPIYFILCLVAAASIILDILTSNETKKSHVSIVLVKIIILVLIIYSGIYFQFPGIYGVDSWWHNQWTQETINIGHITAGKYESNDYYVFPAFHICSAITQIVSGLSTYSAIFINTGVMIAISSLFVFMIGEKVANVKVGMLAALIFPLIPHVMTRATSIIAMSHAIFYYLALLYLLVNCDNKKASDKLLVILLSMALVFTHTVAAMVTLVTIMAVFIGIKVYKKIDKVHLSFEPVSLTLILFFGMFMLFRWMQPHPYTRPFFNVNLSNFIESLQFEAQFVMTEPVIINNIAPVVSLIDNGGNILILALGIIGGFICLYPRNRTGPVLAILSTAAVLIVLPQLLEIFSITGVLPARWLVFSSAPLSILAALSLLRIANIISGNIRKISMAMLLLLALFFMMISNSLVNVDSPMVYNGTKRIGYTRSELTVINTLWNMGSGRPATDVFFGYTFPFTIGYEQFTEMLQEDTRVFIKRNYYLQHPEWNQHYIDRIILGGRETLVGRRELIIDYMKIWGIDNWPVIYRNNNVVVYSNASLLVHNR